MIFFVNIVIPDTDDWDQEIWGTKETVQYKQQKESLIFKTNAIVCEWAVVAHLKDALFTYWTVMSSSWFQLITLWAFPVPETFKIWYGFCAILHEAFDVFLEAFISIIFLNLRYWTITINCHLCIFSAFSVFHFKS